MYKENDLDNLTQKVQGALNKIRPYLKEDGGDVRLVEVTEDLTVKVKLLGACSTCDLNYSTLKAGVEASVKRNVPQIKQVVSVEEGNN